MQTRVGIRDCIGFMYEVPLNSKIRMQVKCCVNIKFELVGRVRSKEVLGVRFSEFILANECLRQGHLEV